MKGFFIWIGLIVGLASCSHKINPEKPRFSKTDFKLDSLPNSEINIPIQLSLQPLYALAEKSVDTLFTSPNYPNDWIEGGCASRFKYVFRRGPLQMNASGPLLHLGFTGYYKIIGSTRLCLNGKIMSPWTPPCKCGFNESERKVNVSFSNSVSLLPDYKIRVSFKRNDPQPVDKCEVCFWGQDITGEVMKGLITELDAAKVDMESQYGIIDLKNRFQQVWDQLNKIYNIYGLGWLQINPQRIHVNNLFAMNDSLNLFLGLSARPVISFEKPPPQSSWVPNLGEFNRHPGFNIFLDAVLNYDSLSRILNQQVVGKQFDINKGPVKKSFIFKECKLFGMGNEKLIIKINFSGSNEGVIYLVGKPVYNNETHVIEIKDLDFDLRSKDALLKATDWLFNKRITNEISKSARFDLSSYIDNAKAGINRQLNREWIRGVRSNGNITEMRLISINPLEQFLVIRSNCTGELSVKMESIPFNL